MRISWSQRFSVVSWRVGATEGARSRTLVRMTTDALRPFDRLAHDWQARRRSPESRDALAALASAEPDIADLAANDLGDLVDALIGPSPVAWRTGRDRGERDQAAAIFRVALRSGHAHPMVARALVQALVPGLVGVGRRLDWGKGGEWESQGAFTADAIATAWEVVEGWCGEDRPYAVLDLLSAVRCRLRRRVIRHHALLHTEQLAADDDGPAEPVATGLSDEEVLARAIDGERDLLDPADAVVLYAHRVLGYSLSELASSTGHSRRFLAARRDRAVASLIA